MSFCLGHPPINPVNGKAQRLPIFNPVDKHGRVFFFSWLSFMLSFMAWYAFPPLLAKTIRTDLKLTPIQVSNSNIVALAAGMLMRLATGPLCDMYGPRKVMVGILLLASIPCGLAGTITSVSGLYCIRFFVGIAGAAFVPCQVWCTGFYDKNVVGTANAFAAGWGNAGAGVTYFVMPAVFDSLVHQRGYTAHVSWRIAFIVPCILLIVCGLGALLLCDDTPTGSWADRAQLTAAPVTSNENLSYEGKDSKGSVGHEVNEVNENGKEGMDGVEAVRHDVVVKPSLKTTASAILCLQTLMLGAPYFCTFGGELSINSILSAYYLQHFPRWGQTKAGRWAAMFGLMNVITRPMGGVIADFLYKVVGPKRGVHVKKYWYGFLCFAQGVMALAIGLANPKDGATLVGLVAGLACFMDAANGAAYALVPHVNPAMNGIMSGTIGASGNAGGIIFAVIFRFTNYAKGIWIIGVFSVIVGLTMMLVHPIPKAQRNGGGYMSH